MNATEFVRLATHLEYKISLDIIPVEPVVDGIGRKEHSPWCQPGQISNLATFCDRVGIIRGQKGCGNITEKGRRSTMSRPVTHKARTEFLAKAGEHLKSMRAALTDGGTSDIRADRSGSSAGSLDSGDLASKELEQHMMVILSAREQDRLIAIDHALKRMAEANYGLCEACGLEIAAQRLKAIPFTRHCRDCQEDIEREAKTRYQGTDIERRGLRGLPPDPAEDEIDQ